MKCANCGNINPKTLFDEGDVFYCSKCCHRTRISDGKDDLIRCPYCGKLRDRKAMNCQWCNSSICDSNGSITNASRKILKDFEDSLLPSNKRYWKIRNK